MGSEMENGIRTPDLLQIGVVGRKTMMRTGAAGIQQTHRITLVAKGGLNADEQVAEVTAKNQKILSIAVEVARRLAPVLFETLGIGRQTLVLLNAHAMGD